MTSTGRLTATVLGAGGIGSKFGGRLAGAGADVWLVTRNSHHASAARRHGLTIVKGDVEEVVQLGAGTDVFEPPPAEFILLAVKSYDTEEGSRQIALYMRGDALAITLQNGLGNIETMAAQLGEERCVLGVTFEGATLVEPGRVADMGSGMTYLAADPATRDRLQRLADALTEGRDQDRSPRSTGSRGAALGQAGDGLWNQPGGGGAARAQWGAIRVRGGSAAIPRSDRRDGSGR